MKLTRRGFMLASTGSFLLSIFGISKEAPAKLKPEPLPPGKYYAIVSGIETEHNGTLVISYQAQYGDTTEWFPIILEKIHE